MPSQLRTALFLMTLAALLPANSATAQCLDDRIEIMEVRHESSAGLNDFTPPVTACNVEDTDLTASFLGSTCPRPSDCTASVSATFSSTDFTLSFSGTAQVTSTGPNFIVSAVANTILKVRAVGGDIDYITTKNGVVISEGAIAEGEEEDFFLSVFLQLHALAATPQNPVTDQVSVDMVVTFKRRCFGACSSSAFCVVATEEQCSSGKLPGAVYLGDDTVCSGEIRWNEVSGGDYSTNSNWNPPQVPVHSGGRSDTAIFPLSGPGGAAIPISAQNATAGEWTINGAIDLNGSAKLLGAGTTQNTLFLFDAGSLLLDAASTLESKNASIGHFVNAAAQGPRVRVRDEGTLWKSTAEVLVSDINGAKLIIEEGAKVEAPFVSTGISIGTTGAIEVRGPAGIGVTPSTLKVTDTLRIGKSQGGSSGGIGSMLIEGGGRVEASSLVVGNNLENGGEKVTVSGFNGPEQRSTLEVTTGDLDMIGDPGTQIEVKDGARLATKNAFIGGGDGLTGNGKVLVNNTESGLPRFDPFTQEGGAFWEVNGTIFVSGDGDAEIVVEDRGLVTAVNVVLGNINNEEGRATVTDSGSVLAVTEDLTIGRDGGNGLLDIGGGGLVTCRNCTVGELDSSESEGEVVVRGIFSSAELRVTEEMNVGASSNSGQGRVHLDGLPFLGGAIVAVGGTLTVGPQGGISGNGVLAVPTGQRVVLAGGFIAPGLSPGQITINGDFEQTEAGVLNMEAAGTGVEQFDVLKITGNAKLAGTLLIKFIDGFIPQPGDVLPFLEVDGAVEGQFTTILTEGLPEGMSLSINPITGEMTVLDGPPAGQVVCGTGTCGASSAGVLPVALVCLVGVRLGRISRRRRVLTSTVRRYSE